MIWSGATTSIWGKRCTTMIWDAKKGWVMMHVDQTCKHSRELHQWDLCYKDISACIVSHQQLQVLPCAVCRTNIVAVGTMANMKVPARNDSFAVEQIATLNVQDHLPATNAQFVEHHWSWVTPEFCKKTPLALNKDDMEWCDYLDMRKEMHYNDLRRQKGLSYDVCRPDLQARQRTASMGPVLQGHFSLYC